MLNSIQLLRAIAAWMVVFYHVMQIYFGLNGDGWFSVFFSKYGSIGVDIFFVISGFVIYNSTYGKNISPTHFMMNRLIRIVPAYWIYTLLTALLVYYYKGLIPFTQLGRGFLVDSLLFIPSMNPSGIGLYPLLTVGWSLNYEMAFYLVFSLALVASERYRLLAICGGIVILQAGLPKLSNEFAFYSENFVYEFLCGVLVCVLHNKGWLKKINFPLAVMIFCIAIAVMTTKEGLPPHGWLHTGNYLYTIGIPCAVIVAVVLSQETYIPNLNLLVQMGNWSYATYLSHVIVLSAAYRTTQIWQISPFVSISAACMAILAISYLSFVFIESRASLYLKNKLAFAIGK